MRTYETTTTTEKTVFISALGSIIFLGCGTGNLLAGVISTKLGWEWVFYTTGIAYVPCILASFVFLTPDPYTAWFLNK